MAELSHERPEFASGAEGTDDESPVLEGSEDAAEPGGSASEGLPPELAFLSCLGLAPDKLDSALRDIEAGAASDVAVLADGLVDEEEFYQALARTLGCAYYVGEIDFGEAFDAAHALRGGLAPLARNRLGLGAVIAPRDSTIIGLLEAVASGRLSADAFAVTSPRRLSTLIRLTYGHAILDDALARPTPPFSAQRGIAWGQGAAIVATILLGCAFGVAWPALFRDFVTIALWFVFSSTVLLRSCALIAGGPAPTGPALSDHELPTYTVVVALYDEAEIVGQLVDALDGLDYVGIMAQTPRTGHLRPMMVIPT